MSTVAVQVESLWSGLLDSNGNPISGGSVYTYEAGATTNKETYTDRAKTTPAANPIILDTYGRSEIYADGLYKFVIKDSDGNTLYDVDNLEYFTFEGSTITTDKVTVDGKLVLDEDTITSALANGDVRLIPTGTGMVKIGPASGDAEVTTEQTDQDLDIQPNGAGLIYFNKGGTGSTGIDIILDEDGLGSNRADAIPTQQSVKAYIDSSVMIEQNKIISGNAESDGFPDFFNYTAATATLDSTSADFVFMANGAQKTLTAGDDVAFAGLTLAPSSNNTCAVDDTNYGDEDFTKTEGEFGNSFIVIDAAGSEITSETGAVQPFKHGAGPEIFYADIVSSTKLGRTRRGIADSNKEEMSDDDVITLLIANHLFLNIDGTTSYTTVNYPKFSSTEPGSPTTGDWYFNTGTELWYRYDGAVFAAINAIWVGSAICDETEIIGIEYQDFYKNWTNEKDFEMSYVSATNISISLKNISVAGVGIKTGDFGTEINLSDSDDRETAVAESVSTLYYIYIDNLGKCRFSDKAPRKKDHREGLYHPSKYWRHLPGMTVWNNADGNIVNFGVDAVNGEYFYFPIGVAADEDWEASTQLTNVEVDTAYVFTDFDECPVYCSMPMFNIGMEPSGAALQGIFFKRRGETYGWSWDYLTHNENYGGYVNRTPMPMDNKTMIARSKVANYDQRIAVSGYSF